MGWLTDPWLLDTSRNGLIATAAVGAACGSAGIWLLALRRAYEAESLSHAILPGLALAAAAAAPLALGAAVGATVALLAFWAVDESDLSSDTSTAVAVTGLVGIGALVGSGEAGRLEALLFGSPLATSAREAAVLAALALLLVTWIWSAHWRLEQAAFDGGRKSSALAILLTGVAAALAGRMLGSLLALALIAGPASGALAISKTMSMAVALAGMLGAVAAITGIYWSSNADVPAGAAVAVIALIPAVALVIKPRLAAR